MIFNHDFYRTNKDLVISTDCIGFDGIVNTPYAFSQRDIANVLAMVNATGSSTGTDEYNFSSFSGTSYLYYSDGYGYLMTRISQDGGVNWKNRDSHISSITTPINVDDYDYVTVSGITYTDNSSLNFDIKISLFKDMPAQKDGFYDYTNWVNLLTVVSSDSVNTSVQRPFSVTVPISELTSESGMHYFSLGVKHHGNVRGYVVNAAIKSIVFKRDLHE